MGRSKLMETRLLQYMGQMARCKPLVPHAILATSTPFAAILDDGSVVTWSDTDTGGDSSTGSVDGCETDSVCT